MSCWCVTQCSFWCQCDGWYCCSDSLLWLVYVQFVVWWCSCGVHRQEVCSFLCFQFCFKSVWMCDCWLFTEMYWETLFCQSCYRQNGLWNRAHIEWDHNLLVALVCHVDPFVSIDCDGIFCCCSQVWPLMFWYVICLCCRGKPDWADMCCCSTVDHKLIFVDVCDHPHVWCSDYAVAVAWYCDRCNLQSWCCI